MNELTPIPIESIQKRLKSPENPGAENYQTLYAALSQMLASFDIAQDAMFSREYEVMLRLRNGSMLPATLRYESFLDDRNIYPTTAVSIYKEKERCASRYWTFTDFDGEIHAHSLSFTDHGWESNGFGLGLMLLTNPVLTHQANQFQPRWNADLLVGIMSDVAWSETCQRTGWTTTWAEAIGYIEQWGRLSRRYPITRIS